MTETRFKIVYFGKHTMDNFVSDYSANSAIIQIASSSIQRRENKKKNKLCIDKESLINSRVSYLSYFGAVAS